MDIHAKGTLVRVCLALLFAAGFLVFLAPVFTGIVNIGNGAGMAVCGVLFFLTLFWSRIFPFICAHKPLRIISIAIIITASLLILLAGFISAKMISAANSPPTDNTTVIILGCKVKGEQPSLMLMQRIMTGCRYLEQHPESMVIVSGGQGSDELISEAECMRRVLMENGIDGDRIIMEDKSTGTDENIRFSLEKMQECGIDGDVTIVTNEFHQLRAKMIADSYGLTSYAVSAPTAKYLLPTYWLREWFGVCYQFIDGLIGY